MFKYSLKRYILIPLLLLSFLGCNFSALASNTNSIEKDISNFYNSTKSIQKQLGSLLESGYINILENTSNDEILKSITTYEQQLDQLRTELVEYNLSNEASKEHASALQTLIVANGYLKYAADQISQYLNTPPSATQYQILKLIIQSDTLLNQLLSYKS